MFSQDVCVPHFAVLNLSLVGLRTTALNRLMRAEEMETLKEMCGMLMVVQWDRNRSNVKASAADTNSPISSARQNSKLHSDA